MTNTNEKNGVDLTVVEIRERLEAMGAEREALIKAFPKAHIQEAIAARAAILAGWEAVKEGIARWQTCQRLAWEESEKVRLTQGDPPINTLASQDLSVMKSEMLQLGGLGKAFQPELLGALGLPYNVDAAQVASQGTLENQQDSDKH